MECSAVCSLPAGRVQSAAEEMRSGRDACCSGALLPLDLNLFFPIEFLVY